MRKKQGRICETKEKYLVLFGKMEERQGYSENFLNTGE